MKRDNRLFHGTHGTQNGKSHYILYNLTSTERCVIAVLLVITIYRFIIYYNYMVPS